MEGVTVGVGVNGYGGDAFVPGGSDDADRDFAAVGNQDLGERAGNGCAGLADKLLTPSVLEEPSAIVRVPPY